MSNNPNTPKHLVSWLKLVEKVKKDNPNLKYKDVLKKASSLRGKKKQIPKEKHITFETGFSSANEVHKTIKGRPKNKESHKRKVKGKRKIPTDDRHQTVASVKRLIRDGKLTDPKTIAKLKKMGII